MKAASGKREMIELADPKRQGKFIHPKEVKAEGSQGVRCAVKIPGHDKSEFCQGDHLIPDMELK